jgi:hypothetical protein
LPTAHEAGSSGLTTLVTQTRAAPAAVQVKPEPQSASFSQVREHWLALPTWMQKLLLQSRLVAQAPPTSRGGTAWPVRQGILP